MIIRWARRIARAFDDGLVAAWLGIGSGAVAEPDIITTAPAYFRRTVTTADAGVRRVVSTAAVSIRRTVTTADGER